MLFLSHLSPSCCPFVHGPCLMFALGVCSGCSFFTGAWKMAYWAWKGIARVKPDPHFHACSLLIGNWSEAGRQPSWLNSHSLLITRNLHSQPVDREPIVLSLLSLYPRGTSSSMTWVLNQQSSCSVDWLSLQDVHPFTEPTRHFISDEAKVWSSQKDLEDGGSLTNFHRGRQKEEANAKHTVYNENLKSCGPVRDIPNVNMTRDRTTDGQTSCTDLCMLQWRDKIKQG